jgi:hypothetical protein
VSLKHVINLIMWIRDTGCHTSFDVLSSILTYDRDKVTKYFQISCCHLTMSYILFTSLSIPFLNKSSSLHHIPADKALQRRWFFDVPLPKSRKLMATFSAAINEVDR